MIQLSGIRRKASGVPILSHVQMDDMGEKLVGDFQPEALEHPQPFDIEAFLEIFMGLRLDYQYLSFHGKYLGMTIFDDTDKVIIYDLDHDRADYLHARAGTVIIDRSLLFKRQGCRLRFTMGHESAGHALLHKDYFLRHPQKNVLCMNPEISFFEDQSTKRRLKTDEDWMEWQADTMSSATLMPRCAVRKLVRAVQDSDIYCSLSDERKPYCFIENMRKFFNVSFQAAVLRLKHFNCIPNAYYYSAGGAEMLLDQI